MKTGAYPKTKATDKNLALISIILGAASFTNSIFTGIPAIIIGIIALKKNAGNRNQAKLGILFGTLGSLLLIPIIMIAVHFLKAPFNQQISLPEEDSHTLYSMAEKLDDYRKKHGHLPNCSQTETDETCTEWVSFISENNFDITYPTVFETSSFEVEDRPVGTLVYATNATCFINTPTDPGYLDGSNGSVKKEKYAALVYFHEKGRACFSTNKD